MAYHTAFFGGSLLDFCGIAGLVLGVKSYRLPWSLACGYIWTSLGGVWVVVMLLADLFRPMCCKNKAGALSPGPTRQSMGDGPTLPILSGRLASQ